MSIVAYNNRSIANISAVPGAATSLILIKTVTVSSATASDTFDDTQTTTLATSHGTSYSVVTVTDDVSSGLTAGNLYEMSVAMRGGIDSSQNSVTMTMFGVIVVVTGDSS